MKVPVGSPADPCYLLYHGHLPVEHHANVSCTWGGSDVKLPKPYDSDPMAGMTASGGNNCKRFVIIQLEKITAHPVPNVTKAVFNTANCCLFVLFISNVETEVNSSVISI